MWAAFIHNNPDTKDVGSAGAFVFGYTSADVLLAFFTPSPGEAALPRVYTEIRPKGYFTDDRAEYYYERLFNSMEISSDTNLGYQVRVARSCLLSIHR